MHARVFAARPGAASLRPVFHTGAVAGFEIPAWDSAPFGASGMLVDTVAKADALAAALGPHQAALLRGHGAVVVGPDIPQAVMVALDRAENAAVALAAGGPWRAVPHLSPEEVEETARRPLTPATVARVWAGRLNRLPPSPAG
ncbi:MAG: class II aldolase/adducin family protein [Acetobacteraceae bacterium]|nr:class II aldolase/adducin family protein [Acetobacteraceae bacterium]